MDKVVNQPTNLAAWLMAKMRVGRSKPMTLRQVCEYSGIKSPATVKAILDGGRVEAETVLKLAAWAGEPFEALWSMAHQERPATGGASSSVPAEVREAIEVLGRDRYIRPEVREWLENIVIEEYRRWKES